MESKRVVVFAGFWILFWVGDKKTRIENPGFLNIVIMAYSPTTSNSRSTITSL
ncbi:hypothetical protein SAMN05444274_10250 [Mariniphaga anaerophila]|uniref:Uncharacterized protein n=1 Tax=Mariniphaga anaerophila TaxID=1484053 RepID=A0A1M4VB84_9BACT|nr:hypothetical protein SAMN05444274_10250 [Mariniphaga anaerophila]